MQHQHRLLIGSLTSTKRMEGRVIRKKLAEPDQQIPIERFYWGCDRRA